MASLSDKDRLKALDALLNARMAHTRWVAEVMHEAMPCVAEDHRECAFGKWLLASAPLLGTVPQFFALIEPHKELHEAYRNMMGSDDTTAMRLRIRELSRILIDNIDALEKFLKKPGAA